MILVYEFDHGWVWDLDLGWICQRNRVREDDRGRERICWRESRGREREDLKGEARQKIIKN